MILSWINSSYYILPNGDFLILSFLLHLLTGFLLEERMFPPSLPPIFLSFFLFDIYTNNIIVINITILKMNKKLPEPKLFDKVTIFIKISCLMIQQQLKEYSVNSMFWVSTVYNLLC